MQIAPIIHTAFKRILTDLLGEDAEVILCNVNMLQKIEKIETRAPVIIYGFKDEKILIPDSWKNKNYRYNNTDYYDQDNFFIQFGYTSLRLILKNIL